MAAYLYSADDYAWWSARLGRPLEPGTFGENLTVTGLPDAEVLVGDVLRIGGAVAQVTAPRIPCFKLGLRMGDKRFVPEFRDAARLGFYVRTLREGPVTAGDVVELLERGTPGVTITEIARLHMHAEDDLDGLRAALAAREHLHARWATWVEDRVAALTRTGG
jgi:MOSC domain-containing protein YiiM